MNCLKNPIKHFRVCIYKKDCWHLIMTLMVT
nr:MAG TPA_asm: hypothetical protein [Bacteriophage sp.]